MPAQAMFDRADRVVIILLAGLIGIMGWLGTRVVALEVNADQCMCAEQMVILKEVDVRLRYRIDRLEGWHRAEYPGAGK